MRELLKDICDNKDVRTNLSTIVALIREEGVAAFDANCKNKMDFILPLLKNEDAKVRKNAAKLCGFLQFDGVEELLMEAYRKENVHFVKASYLCALKDKDVTEYRAELEQFRNCLLAENVNEENRKHISEEILAINDLIGVSNHRPHRYVENLYPVDVILCTTPETRSLVFEAITEEKKKEVAPGVFIRTTNVSELFQCRLFKEMLFALPKLHELPGDPYEAAVILANSELLTFLDKQHKGGEVYNYRVALRCNWEDKKKTTFLKRFTGELQRNSKQRLVNAPGDYEFELRMVANKEGAFRLFVKLFTIEDKRFSYREESVAASIHPVDAALTMEVAKEYLKEEAQVLDPFCGVCTMLVERNFVSPIKPVYAIDTYDKALEKARINLRKAQLSVNLIHRDFFDFKHEYLFDEIITNMPFTLCNDELQNIMCIYRKFFDKAGSHLKEDGIIVMYTRNEDMARSFGKKTSFTLLKRTLIHEKDNAYVLVFQKAQ